MDALFIVGDVDCEAMIAVDDGVGGFALDFDALFFTLFLSPPLRLSLDFLFSGIIPGSDSVGFTTFCNQDVNVIGGRYW